MHTKCGDPSARSEQGHGICPELLAGTNTKGASWQQLCSGIEKVVNNEY